MHKYPKHSGCESPSDCIRLANDLIETLPQKWNPAGLSDMTPNPANDEDDEWKPFLPSLMTAESVRDIFRVFTEGALPNEAIMNTEPEQGPSTIVATDGSTLNIGTTSARAGAGIFYHEGDPKNSSI
jgi:hypothetical protein